MDISLGMENRDDIPVLNTLQNFSKKLSITVQVIKQLGIVVSVVDKLLLHFANIFIEWSTLV